jgi:hypothetical protein
MSSGLLPRISRWVVGPLPDMTGFPDPIFLQLLDLTVGNPKSKYKKRNQP